MVNVIIEVSKYLLIILMALYTYWNFRYFRYQEEWQQNRVCTKQNAVMLSLIHILPGKMSGLQWDLRRNI